MIRVHPNFGKFFINYNFHRKLLFLLLLFKASIFIVHCEASCSCSLVILLKFTAQNLQF